MVEVDWKEMEGVVRIFFWDHCACSSCALRTLPTYKLYIQKSPMYVKVSKAVGVNMNVYTFMALSLFCSDLYICASLDNMIRYYK